jgi:CheY-like chemotaxis protein
MEADQVQQKKVLIVDDETPFILSLTTGLETYSTEYGILTAENGKEAIKILESTQVDLVVTDLRMPEMDGFGLLAFISANFPSIPAIVMSAFGTPEIKDRLSTLGTLKFLEKPVDFQELTASISDGLTHENKGGSLNGISIASFLQLIEMEEKTCLLEIQGDDTSLNGVLYFNKGVLYDAICGKLKGKGAALEIIGWENAEVRFRELPKKKISKRIEADLISLIMEAMKYKDESASQEDEEPIEIEDVADILSDDFEESTTMDGPPLDGRGHLGEVETENQEFMGTGKETKVNVQKLYAAVELLKNDLGSALLAADIFGSADGQSIAGHNSQPKASALFGQLTLFLGKSLEGSGFPKLGKYYILDLADAKMVIVIPLGDYQWGLLIDTKKVQLGLLLNVVMPKIIDAFEEAIAG